MPASRSKGVGADDPLEMRIEPAREGGEQRREHEGAKPRREADRCRGSRRARCRRAARGWRGPRASRGDWRRAAWRGREAARRSNRRPWPTDEREPAPMPIGGMAAMPLWEPSASTLPNRKSMAMPQAMVESGRKWPPRRKVAAPRTAAVAPESDEPDREPDEGRARHRGRPPGGRIGADAEEGGLAEGGDPACPRHHHETERHEGEDRDVVEERQRIAADRRAARSASAIAGSRGREELDARRLMPRFLLGRRRHPRRA